MEDSTHADQLHNLWWLLLQTRRASYRVREKELFRYGITPEEAAVLFVIEAIGYQATPAEIARWLLREPQSALGIVNRMVRKGLLSRVKDLDKRNLVRVSITKKGRQVYSEATNIESIYRIMSSLSEEQCKQLEGCLETLRSKALAELGMTYEPPKPNFIIKAKRVKADEKACQKPCKRNSGLCS